MKADRSTQFLQILEKAVTSGNITAIVPEDLEVQAHSTLWDESDANELTILKLLPSTPATSIRHEFTRITSYGRARGHSGFFSETSLPPETNFGSERVTKNIRLMGEIGSVFLLASLEKTQQALGTSGAANIERNALMKSILKKKNIAVYFSDTTKRRLGSASLVNTGLMQQIREGTDGTDHLSPYGSHIINMGGAALNPDTLRDRFAKGVTLFGGFNALIMDPLVRSDFEGTLDGSYRIPLPIASTPYLLGQSIQGLQTNNKIIRFFTDNSLTPMYSRGQYSTDVFDGAPSTRPTVTAAAGAGVAASDWDQASAGNVFYVVTEIKDEFEGLGTRAPTGVSGLAVAAGERVTLTLTPGTPTADAFRVYRGNNDVDTDADSAWFIFDVANSGSGGAVVAYDDNLWRPNTSVAFGLNIIGEAFQSLVNSTPGAYESTREKAMAGSFLARTDNPRNTVTIAELGPSMGMMQLPSPLAKVENPLIYSAYCPEVRNPMQNIVLINIGRS